MIWLSLGHREVHSSQRNKDNSARFLLFQVVQLLKAVFLCACFSMNDEAVCDRYFKVVLIFLCVCMSTENSEFDNIAGFPIITVEHRRFSAI